MSLVRFFSVFLIFIILEITLQTKHGNKFLKPCFEEDKNLAHCSSSDESCDNNFMLVQLPGIRVSKMSVYIYFFKVYFIT